MLRSENYFCFKKMWTSIVLFKKINKSYTVYNKIASQESLSYNQIETRHFTTLTIKVICT